MGRLVACLLDGLMDGRSGYMAVLLLVFLCEYVDCQSWEDDHEYECGLHQGIGAKMVNQGLEAQEAIDQNDQEGKPAEEE